MHTDKGSLRGQPPARALNLSDQELETAGDLLTEFLRSFERSLDNRRVMPVLDRNQLSELFAAPFPDVGIGVESLFRDIQEKVLPNCTTVAHRRFLAYVLGPPNGIAHMPRRWRPHSIRTAISGNCRRSRA